MGIRVENKRIVLSELSPSRGPSVSLFSYAASAAASR